MLLSLRTDQVEIALDFVKELELTTGGIRGWQDSPAYPEVSGYLIPTLLDYGERDLATRIADWLIGIQNDDGSFNDMDGQKRSFDTAVCMEGLQRIHGKYEYTIAIDKALNWLLKYVRKDGAVRIVPGWSLETHLYTMRVSWLINSQAGADYWLNAEWPDTREHYVAYALEGLWNMGEEEFVRQKLLERDWASDDLCANAQMVILHYQAGLNYIHLVDLVESHIGKMINSWTAKWMLDMWKVVGEA